MAFGKTSVSESNQEFGKLYEGLTQVNVIAVNPSKDELSKIYNREQEKDPQYIFEKDNVKSALVSFLVKDITETVKGYNNITFFVRDEIAYNKDNTKVQVIDKYGRTTWIDLETAKKGEVPTYTTKNGVTLDRVAAGYRPAYKGEAELVEFLKTYLGIPNVVKFEGSQPVGLVDKPEDCECALENIKEYFKGNFKEIKDAINLEPNALAQALYYPSPNAESGRMYQRVLPKVIRPFAKPATLKKWVEERQQFGAYSGLVFKFDPIKEYVETPTNFEQQTTGLEDLPW